MYATYNIFLRSVMSARAPAGRINRKNGSVAAVDIRERSIVRITAQAVTRKTEVELTFRPNVINGTPNRASPRHGHGATTSKPILGWVRSHAALRQTSSIKNDYHIGRIDKSFAWVLAVSQNIMLEIHTPIFDALGIEVFKL